MQKQSSYFWSLNQEHLPLGLENNGYLQSDDYWQAAYAERDEERRQARQKRNRNLTIAIMNSYDELDAEFGPLPLIWEWSVTSESNSHASHFRLDDKPCHQHDDCKRVCVVNWWHSTDIVRYGSTCLTEVRFTHAEAAKNCWKHLDKNERFNLFHDPLRGENYWMDILRWSDMLEECPNVDRLSPNEYTYILLHHRSESIYLFGDSWGESKGKTDVILTQPWVKPINGWITTRGIRSVSTDTHDELGWFACREWGEELMLCVKQQVMNEIGEEIFPEAVPRCEPQTEEQNPADIVTMAQHKAETARLAVRQAEADLRKAEADLQKVEAVLNAAIQAEAAIKQALAADAQKKSAHATFLASAKEANLLLPNDAEAVLEAELEAIAAKHKVTSLEGDNE